MIAGSKGGDMVLLSTSTFHQTSNRSCSFDSADRLLLEPNKIAFESSDSLPSLLVLRNLKVHPLRLFVFDGFSLLLEALSKEPSELYPSPYLAYLPVMLGPRCHQTGHQTVEDSRSSIQSGSPSPAS